MTAGHGPEGPALGAEPATGFRSGRIITPGSPRQLGKLGLFPPSEVQRRVLTPTTHPITARNAEPDLLWISFAELCGGQASTADFLALATDHRMWVIDGVPSPQLESALVPASAWQRFGQVVELLHEQDIALFLLGTGPFDWGNAAIGAAGARSRGPGAILPVDMARIAGRLAMLGRMESQDTGEAGYEFEQGAGS